MGRPAAHWGGDCFTLQDPRQLCTPDGGADSQETASATLPVASGLMWSIAHALVHSASAHPFQPLPASLHPHIPASLHVICLVHRAGSGDAGGDEKYPPLFLFLLEAASTNTEAWIEDSDLISKPSVAI